MTFRHTLPPSSLREYDVRGIVGRTLGEDDARAVGRGFGTLLRRQGGTRAAVGYDGRLSSPALEAALVEGLLASGVDVLRVGCGPTPMLYFAAVTLGADGGVMVTGSHNPPDYNGFKMMLAGKPFFGEQIRLLGSLAASGDLEQGAGHQHLTDVSEAYLERLLADWDGGDRALKVVWDNGNGAAGDVLTRLVAGLPGHHVVLNAAIDGRFPAHHPAPTIPAHRAQLIDEVRATRADLGIALDGDADRIGIVDGDGAILWGDQILVLLARDVLQSYPGATIIADVKASRVLFDEIARAGGVPLMWRTGHSLIKSKMAETNSPLAGEMSGHIFFADKWYGFDDALYAAIRLLGIIARSGQSLAALRASLPRTVTTPELRFDCADDRKFTVVAEVSARLAASGADTSDVDGVRVNTPDGWWLLRASNTQAVLVARAESQTEQGLEILKAALAEQLTASGIDSPDFSGSSAGH